MKRVPGLDALLLILLVIGCLEIAQTPAYDALDGSGALLRATWLQRATVRGEPPHPLVVLGKLTGPIRLLARSASMLALLLYLLVDLVERHGAWRNASLAWIARRSGGCKALLASVLVGLLVVLPAVLSIAGRAWTGDHGLAHDGGTVQVEESAGMLLQGRNPYATSFRGTPLEHWRGFLSDAVEHVPYLPLGFLTAVPGVLLAGEGYDQRLLYLGAYGTMLLMAAWILPQGDRRRIALLGLALNPFLVKFLILGTNDVAALAWLVASLVALRRNRPGLAGVLLGAAASTKQFALLAVPFLALHLLWAEKRSGSRHWSAQAWVRFLFGIAMVLVFIVGPFLIWDAGAMLQDVLLYPAGGLSTSFPIQGLHGYGFGTVPLFFRWVPTARSDFPFWIFQLVALALTLPVLLAHQRRSKSLGASLYAFTLCLLVFLFFARYFHANFAGFLLALPPLAFGLADPLPRETFDTGGSSGRNEAY